MSKPDKPQPRVLGQEYVMRWLVAFQVAINSFDPVAIGKLLHQNTIGFDSGGTSKSTSQLVVCDQLEKLCRTVHHTFVFLMSDARVIPAPGMFVVAIKYMTTRKMVGYEPEFGQATFVLCDFEGKLLGVHSHISSCPG